MDALDSYKLYVVFENNDYKEIEDFHFGFAAAYHENGVCGFIDLKGHETLLLDYKNIESFYGNIAPVFLDGKWGFIDYNFDEIIPCQYSFMMFYKNGFIVNESYNDQFKAIDSSGNIVYSDWNMENVKKYLSKIPPIFEIVDDEIKKEEYKILGLNKKVYSYVNSDGEKIFEYSNLENRDFHDGYVVVKVANNDFKIFNKKGKKLKIHTSIFESDYECDLVKSLKFRITSKVELESKVKIKR